VDAWSNNRFTEWKELHSSRSSLFWFFSFFKREELNFARMFITSIAPFSFYALGRSANFITDVTFNPAFSESCGLIQSDVDKMLCDIYSCNNTSDTSDTFKYYQSQLKSQFNGHRFSYKHGTSLIYNTNSVLKYLKVGYFFLLL
jgi:hypothetical protein